MPTNATGIVSMGDGFAIAENASELSARLNDFVSNEHTSDELKKRYGLGKNYGDWLAGNRVEISGANLRPVSICYRPFDVRWTYFDNTILWRWREKVMKHMVAGENISLVTCRQSAIQSWEHVFVSDGIVDDSYISNRTKERSYCYPLYIYPDDQELDQTRRINFDEKLFGQLKVLATCPRHGEPDELNVFDYIYGVLHCPAYRVAYAEFLKVDFPRIPWPANFDEFWDVSIKGAKLRKLHLLDPIAIGAALYPLSGSGDARVDELKFHEGKLWINSEQYFDEVPQVAWELFIGGYQPARKWLKDRRGRSLSFADVKHYQRILKVLSETSRIMDTIKMTFKSD